MTIDEQALLNTFAAGGSTLVYHCSGFATQAIQNKDTRRRPWGSTGNGEQQVNCHSPNSATTGSNNSTSTYDAFISYRHAQGWRVSSWLNARLERYRPPKQLLMQLPSTSRERLQKAHRVFLDTRYERSSRDFWDVQN